MAVALCKGKIIKMFFFLFERGRNLLPNDYSIGYANCQKSCWEVKNEMKN